MANDAAAAAPVNAALDAIADATTVAGVGASGGVGGSARAGLMAATIPPVATVHPGHEIPTDGVATAPCLPTGPEAATTRVNIDTVTAAAVTTTAATTTAAAPTATTPTATTATTSQTLAQSDGIAAASTSANLPHQRINTRLADIEYEEPDPKKPMEQVQWLFRGVYEYLEDESTDEEELKEQLKSEREERRERDYIRARMQAEFKGEDGPPPLLPRGRCDSDSDSESEFISEDDKKPHALPLHHKPRKVKLGDMEKVNKTDEVAANAFLIDSKDDTKYWKEAVTGDICTPFHVAHCLFGGKSISGDTTKNIQKILNDAPPSQRALVKEEEESRHVPLTVNDVSPGQPFPDGYPNMDFQNFCYPCNPNAKYVPFEVPKLKNCTKAEKARWTEFSSPVLISSKQAVSALIHIMKQYGLNLTTLKKANLQGTYGQPPTWHPNSKVDLWCSTCLKKGRSGHLVARAWFDPLEEITEMGAAGPIIYHRSSLKVYEVYFHDSECSTPLAQRHSTMRLNNDHNIHWFPYNYIFGHAIEPWVDFVNSFQEDPSILKNLPPGTPISFGETSNPHDFRTYYPMCISENHNSSDYEEVYQAYVPEHTMVQINVRIFLWIIAMENLTRQFITKEPDYSIEPPSNKGFPKMQFPLKKANSVSHLIGPETSGIQNGQRPEPWGTAPPDAMPNPYEWYDKLPPSEQELPEVQKELKEYEEWRADYCTHQLAHDDGQNYGNEIFLNPKMMGLIPSKTYIIPTYDEREIWIGNAEKFVKVRKDYALSFPGNVEHGGKTFVHDPRKPVKHHHAFHIHLDSKEHRRYSGILDFATGHKSYMPPEHAWSLSIPKAEAELIALDRAACAAVQAVDLSSSRASSQLGRRAKHIYEQWKPFYSIADHPDIRERRAKANNRTAPQQKKNRKAQSKKKSPKKS